LAEVHGGRLYRVDEARGGRTSEDIVRDEAIGAFDQMLVVHMRLHALMVICGGHIGNAGKVRYDVMAKLWPWFMKVRLKHIRRLAKLQLSHLFGSRLTTHEHERTKEFSRNLR
jgi:hypothetical protein